MAKKATRLKAKAQIYVTQTKDDAATDIRRIGDLQRQLLRAATEMNDAVAAVTHNFQPRMETIKNQLQILQDGVQGYCEAHRLELTDGGKVKTAHFITGEVQWRKRPPSVSVRSAEAVIATLKRLGLERYVRTKEEINKDAILDEPDAVSGVSGIKVVKDIEDFVITPFEQEVTV